VNSVTVSNDLIKVQGKKRKPIRDAMDIRRGIRFFYSGLTFRFYPSRNQLEADEHPHEKAFLGSSTFPGPKYLGSLFCPTQYPSLRVVYSTLLNFFMDLSSNLSVRGELTLHDTETLFTAITPVKLYCRDENLCSFSAINMKIPAQKPWTRLVDPDRNRVLQLIYR